MVIRLLRPSSRSTSPTGMSGSGCSTADACMGAAVVSSRFWSSALIRLPHFRAPSDCALWWGHNRGFARMVLNQMRAQLKQRAQDELSAVSLFTGPYFRGGREDRDSVSGAPSPFTAAGHDACGDEPRADREAGSSAGAWIGQRHRRAQPRVCLASPAASRCRSGARLAWLRIALAFLATSSDYPA